MCISIVGQIASIYLLISFSHILKTLFICCSRNLIVPTLETEMNLKRSSSFEAQQNLLEYIEAQKHERVVDKQTYIFLS